INLTPNGESLLRNMNTRRNKRRGHQARHHREEVEGGAAERRTERGGVHWSSAAEPLCSGGLVRRHLGPRDRGLRKSAMIPDDETEHALPKRNQQRHLGAGGVEHHPPRTS
ncbi:unnamed protein product, partial [Ixodes pacificus]